MDPYGKYGLSSDEVSTGTSIMAVEFDRGVVIAADSRTTSAPYIANRVTDKLTPVFYIQTVYNLFVYIFILSHVLFYLKILEF